jgi:hypothetical protein
LSSQLLVFRSFRDQLHRDSLESESDIVISLRSEKNSNMDGFQICDPKSKEKKYFVVVCIMLLTTEFIFSIVLQNKIIQEKGEKKTVSLSSWRDTWKNIEKNVPGHRRTWMEKFQLDR